jgi:hypothetical protein
MQGLKFVGTSGRKPIMGKGINLMDLKETVGHKNVKDL